MNNFFSIIIPAHNEELYIEETLKNTKALNYNSDNFEVVVIENGSSDKTYEKAKIFESSNTKVLSSKRKGVSAARNLGVDTISEKSDWIVFLDADTILKPDFLKELDILLTNDSDKNYAAGTTALRPSPDSFKARVWFKFYDFGHWLFHVSYSIQLAKSSIVKQNKIKYDESLSAGEDLKFLKDCLKFGKFLFLNTKSVYTSTRRFTEIGWWKLFFMWMVVANLPKFIQKKHDYKVVR